MEQAYPSPLSGSEGLKNVGGLYQARTQRAILHETKLHSDANTGSEQQSKRKKFAFPTPSSEYSKEQAYFCSADRILTLYNKSFGSSQKRVTSTVRSWFEREAYQAGWAKVTFLADVQASRSAGYMLIPPHHAWR